MGHKYKKKPAIVDAEQFWPDKPWPKGVVERCRSEVASYHGDPDDMVPVVITIHGQPILVAPGDYIVMEPDGMHAYPCKPDIFEERHEIVESNGS